MKNKSKNITAKKKNGDGIHGDQYTKDQIQAMTWDEILAKAGKPVSHEEMIQNLQKAKAKHHKSPGRRSPGRRSDQ